jgi:hypothetical protein
MHLHAVTVQFLSCTFGDKQTASDYCVQACINLQRKNASTHRTIPKNQTGTVFRFFRKSTFANANDNCYHLYIGKLFRLIPWVFIMGQNTVNLFLLKGKFHARLYSIACLTGARDNGIID